MHAEVLTGQLVYVDAEENLIQIMNKDNSEVTDLSLDIDTRFDLLPGLHNIANCLVE